MKKYISILVLVTGFNLSQAQEITDALRFSQNDMTGTARFRAMSGAFGALGGDLSAINSNPASSSIFANNQFGGTLNISNATTKTIFFGSNATEKNAEVDINQAGAVFVFNNNSEKNKWNKFAVAINYENLNNFNSNLFYSGRNINSIGNYFVSYANGVKQGTLNDFYYDELTYNEQQAYLGYWAYIINPIPLNSDPLNPDNPNISQYESNVAPGGNYYQQNDILSTGYNGKLSFNASAQYDEKLTIGVNINSHFTDYTRSSRFYETNFNNTSGSTDYVHTVYFNNDLHTFGNGFSFQVGGIYKASDLIRLGASYESPTWFRLEDELIQSVRAITGNPTDGDLPADVVNPNIIMVYPYKLQTPDKWTISGALVFGKEGIISIDYSTKNYGSMQYKSANNDSAINNQLSTVFTNSTEYRIGFEKKLNQWSLRGGYRFEESPYKDKTRMGDLTGYSGGFGYNFGATKLDFAYSTAKRNYTDQMFSQGLTDKAFINSKNNNITVTLAFEL
ncbi:transporter [Flavobacterium amnicola]|uniref:Transporter n=1 Tax=Flavobacterium amnicola TaxID=2506422 RepID=A0A4Q1K375_9FLAO|nr:outer membrane protein transport protein [Flavobacterium amnicola]RXR18429.1 transporter [Flavobacterium amnicola]